MRTFAIAAAAALSVAACASSPQTAEIGYAKGTLGYAAMMNQDWHTAEAQLVKSAETHADDPAVLLNLAQVYRATERESEARNLYNRVLETKDAPLVLAGGSVASAHSVAKSALGSQVSSVQ